MAFIGYGGNYGYNSQQQLEECTPPVNFVPLGIFLYPGTSFCTQVIKVYPQKHWESSGYLFDKLEFDGESPLTMRAQCSAFRCFPNPLGIVTAKPFDEVEFTYLFLIAPIP